MERRLLPLRWFAAALSLATLASVAFANQLVVGPNPAATHITAPGSPACASSANGTAHLICIYGDSTNRLFAFSLQTQKGGFPASPFDPAKGNPLSLGVSGTVGISSCASTADASGDVVCAYTSTTGSTSGRLLGIRFNIFTGTIYPVRNLGFSINGTAACANGFERFKVTGPPAQEGPSGATICVGRNAGNNFLRAVAFNPASGYLSAVNGNEVATTDPTCTNANDGTEQVICVYNTAGSLRSEAFNTSPFEFISAELNIYPSTVFGAGDTVSCSAPNDRSGDVLCAVLNFPQNVLGFAVNPRTGHRSALQSLPGQFAKAPLAGTPSCAGIGDSTFAVICSFVMNPVPGLTDNLVYAIKFDPRTGLLGNLMEGDGVSGSASCTFQNVNPAQISCAAPNGELLGFIFNP